MTDQQILGVTASSNAGDIKKALIQKISNLDFENDIENILNYVNCSRRLIEKRDNNTEEADILVTEEISELANSDYDYGDTPQKLISHFAFLYNNPSTRSNKLLWKSAIESLKIYDSIQLEEYLKPIADFLNVHPFIKTEILIIIGDNLPFRKFFSKANNEENREFWKQYGFVYNLLSFGNLSFDLYADIINTGEFTTAELDTIYVSLLNSDNYYRSNDLINAFNVLCEGIPENLTSLLIWQRKLNILSKAIFREKTENISELFQNILQNALTAFPEDDQLLYLRAKFFFHFYSAEESKEEIIATLRIIPHHEKCLFLLGKCYMQLGVPHTAHIIFEHLKKSNPLNMQYVTASAIAGRKYIDFCISKHNPKVNDKQFYIHIINTLIENEMFEEIAVFAEEAPKEDLDIAALLYYAKHTQDYLLTGEKNREELKKSLWLATDKSIIKNIREYCLKNLPKWSDYEKEKDFIFDYFQEFPEDSDAHYYLGMYYFAVADYEKAYEYFLRAKEINPDNIYYYYNLARVTLQLEIHSEALEYINIYLYYNKYDVVANEIYCDCTFPLKQYKNTHNRVKFLLSLCRDHEFNSKHFYYLTTSLYYHLDTFESKYHNHDYISDVLKLYDQYPKPSTFWENDNGSRSMYWAAKLCHKLGDYQKGVEYIQCILENVKEYNWELMEKCKFQLLPECLHGLQQYEKIISLLEKPTLDLLQKQPFDPSVRLSCFYISHAYGILENNEESMKWAWYTIKCFMKMDNPDIGWVDHYLLYNFNIACDRGINEYIISFGKAYLEIIRIPKKDHVWLTHKLADFYSKTGKKAEALHYHKMCVDFGLNFTENYDETRKSKEYIDSVN